MVQTGGRHRRHNAFFNKNLAFKHLNLHQVAGSVAYNGWWEYGGANYTLAKFKQNPADSHSWLEDDEGNIYDYTFAWNCECAVINKGSRGAMKVGELRKVSPTDAAALGLTYKKADSKSMDFLLTHNLRGIVAQTLHEAMDMTHNSALAFRKEVAVCEGV